MEMVKNFLNIEDLELLKKYIYNYYDSLKTIDIVGDINYNRQYGIKYIERKSGRALIQINLKRFPKKFLNKFNEFAEKINKDAKINGIIFLRYDTEFGKPNLSPHTDDHEIKISIDFQINSNTDFPIFVDNNEFNLSNNDALYFNSTESVHWRKPKKFNKGEFVDVLLFHYVSTNKN